MRPRVDLPANPTHLTPHAPPPSTLAEALNSNETRKSHEKDEFECAKRFRCRIVSGDGRSHHQDCSGERHHVATEQVQSLRAIPRLARHLSSPAVEVIR